MNNTKINLSRIPTDLVHEKTVFRKKLVKVTDRPGGMATANYAWIEKDKQLPPHVHPDGIEFYLFLDGSGEMLVGDKWFPVGKNDFVTVPQNQIHSLKNVHSQPLFFITFRTVR
jgi:mannose-6-phosphate isomerase-like protein (cupin superfamily)